MAATTADATYYGTINVAQPPFDDIHVRRALLMLLDPGFVLRLWWAMGDQGAATSHLVPDAMDNSLLASWDPFGTGSSVDRTHAIRAEVDASRYGRSGRCVGSVCKVTLVILDPYDVGDAEISRIEGYYRRALGTLGIASRFRVFNFHVQTLPPLLGSTSRCAPSRNCPRTIRTRATCSCPRWFGDLLCANAQTVLMPFGSET